MANVQFENLFKNYGDVKAVEDFNLKIADKELNSNIDNLKNKILYNKENEI